MQTNRQDHRLPAQLAARLAQRIETHALRPGTRLPSIRNCAVESRVSRSTVVEAYDQLIAAGLIESRRGSGFYVRHRHAGNGARRRGTNGAALQSLPGTVLDVSWLLRAQRRQSPGSEQPGAGLLPENWLDHELVASAVRGVGRSRGSWLLKYGAVEGYLPLREALSTRLSLSGIDVGAEHIITTAGATEAIDLVARRFLAPGDLVFVEDPAWFVMFARFAAFGARLMGVPRGPDGPDIAALESLLARERPKLFILNSVAHNPTGSCMSHAVAARVLELAARHDFMILEDDIYGDLQGRHAVRLASVDDGRRVIYAGGFSKTLAPNLRVGFVAAHPALAAELRDWAGWLGLPEVAVGRRGDFARTLGAALRA
jgi:DNA-binding transcriptional MocR family regulator